MAPFPVRKSELTLYADDTSLQPLAGRSILIAEDEGIIAFELADTLQSLGCQIVGPVSSVSEVLEQLETGAIDGALLDVNLRGEQIFTISPILLEHAFPIIFTSGYNDPKLFPEAFRSSPRIAKPFDQHELQALCLRVFSKAS
jgi:CheY-like chemotaxis protein